VQGSLLAQALDCSGGRTAQKVEDDRDNSEDQQEMNQKARCVEDNKTAHPGQEQHDTDNQKHSFLLAFLVIRM
jgi:hypothetical protein